MFTEIFKIAIRAAISGWLIGFFVGAVMGFWLMLLLRP